MDESPVGVSEPGPPNLPTLTFIAWLMIVVGLLSGFLFLIALVVPPAHRHFGSAEAESSKRLVLVFCTYAAMVTVAFGHGLRKRLAWAWDGTVSLAGTTASVAAALPFGMIHGNSTKASTVIGGAVLAVLVGFPALAVLIYLARSIVRERFTTPTSLRGAEPTVWIRLIAIGNLIGSGCYICDLLNPTPVPVFGLALRGVPLYLYLLANTGVLIYCGHGLYRLRESARRVEIGYSIFSAGQLLVWGVLTPTPYGGISYSRAYILLICTALSALTVWYLVTRRWMFES